VLFLRIPRFSQHPRSRKWMEECWDTPTSAFPVCTMPSAIANLGPILDCPSRPGPRRGKMMHSVLVRRLHGRPGCGTLGTNALSLCSPSACDPHRTTASYVRSDLEPTPIMGGELNTSFACTFTALPLVCASSHFSPSYWSSQHLLSLPILIPTFLSLSSPPPSLCHACLLPPTRLSMNGPRDQKHCSNREYH